MAHNEGRDRSDDDQTLPASTDCWGPSRRSSCPRRFFALGITFTAELHWRFFSQYLTTLLLHVALIPLAELQFKFLNKNQQFSNYFKTIQSILTICLSILLKVQTFLFISTFNCSSKPFDMNILNIFIFFSEPIIIRSRSGIKDNQIYFHQ